MRYFKFLLFFIILNCISYVFANDYPDYVKINKIGGISLRETVDPSSEALGAVYNGYTYEVTDANPAYIQVKTSDGALGWAWVGQDDERFDYLEDKVQSKVNYNIPVKIGDKQTFIQPNELVDLVAVWHNRLKVKTPDNKHGWIYAGKYDDPWVIFRGNVKDVNSIYAIFESNAIDTNVNVSSKKIQYFSQNGSYRFVHPKQSEVNLEFDLAFDYNRLKQLSVIDITHMVAEKKSTDTSISIIVNGTALVERLRPVFNQFQTDSFNIGHLLEPGINKVTIRLDRSNTSYFVQAIKIRK